MTHISKVSPPFNFHAPWAPPVWETEFIFTFPRVPCSKKQISCSLSSCPFFPPVPGGMEDTGDCTVETGGSTRVEFRESGYFPTVRSLRTSECFQSPGDQVFQLGVDDSVFCALSLNTWQGVWTSSVYDRICEFTHNSTDVCANTVTQADHSCTLSWHLRYFVMFLFCCFYRWSSSRVGTVSKITKKRDSVSHCDGI
jgi:hypothetical protein